MNRAALYQRSNGLQRRDAKLVIDNFAQYMQWRPDGQDSLLDIGCGSGDVTIDYILPMLPRNFSRLVGIDLSEPMVRHAREQYPHPNIDFHTLDFDGDIEKYISNTEPFDHITSFYCLHWLQNQQRAVQNIHRLLKPGGDCLLSLMTNCPLYDVYSRVAQYPEWAPYMADVNRFISPYHYSEEPCAEFTSMLAAAGFKEFTVKMRKRTHIFDGVDSMKNTIAAVSPFLERISREQQNEFIDEHVKLLPCTQLTHDDAEHDHQQFLTTYEMMIVYARK